MEPKILYRSSVEQVPISDYTLPLSKIETLVPGSDLTLLTWGTPLYTCEMAMSMLSSPPPSLQGEGFVPRDARKASVELIDLRTILPWDMEGVIESVNRTGRLVIVHEAGKTGGVGAEIAAEVQKRCFLKLAAPVKRVCGWEYALFFALFTCLLTTPQHSSWVAVREVLHPRRTKNIGCYGRDPQVLIYTHDSIISRNKDGIPTSSCAYIR